MERYRNDIETRLTARHKMAMRIGGEPKDKNILDIGCSIGWYEKFAVEAGCKLVVGMDTEGADISIAKDMVDGAHFISSSVLCLPFMDCCFDVVTMFDVIEHTPKNSEADCLNEISRVLKEDGILVLSTPNNNFVAKVLDPAWYLGHRHYSRGGLEKLLRESGFRVELVDSGGSFFEVISMLLLYVFKWMFKLEIPYKRFFENKKNKEYSGDGKGFTTLFVKARSGT